mgnify:CR=1 FL=1
MSDDKFLDEILTNTSTIGPTYKSFLNSFIENVELLSRYGDNVWGHLFDEINIYTPKRERKEHLIEWYERDKIPDHTFHLQCAFLREDGIYKSNELGQYSYFPENPEWLLGENQTARYLALCKGNKRLISALFIYAHINSKSRNHIDGYDKYLFVEAKDFRFNPTSSLNKHDSFEEDFQPCGKLESTIIVHLNKYGIPHSWAQACTSLIPIINNQRRNRVKIFSSLYDFSEYLADKFVLLSSKLSVCTYNLTTTEDLFLMSKIKKYTILNKKENIIRRREIEHLQEKEKEENLKRKMKTLLEYELVCNKIYDYTDEIPSEFKMYWPLENHWRVLDPKNLELLIWMTPLSLLAKMFRKSDNTVRKWARENKILLPKAGFWAKVRSRTVEYPNGKPNLKYSTR